MQFESPASVCSLAVGGNFIFTGCDDGTMRVYNLSGPPKVLKAVRGLGGEVSSIACMSSINDAIPDVWAACGTCVSLFSMQVESMILNMSNASSSVELCTSTDDVLNEICIDDSNTTLAFSADSGIVGTMDLRSRIVKVMKAKHTNVCGSVKFIPDRPREILSGGYDQRLMHFDYQQGSSLSYYDIATLPPTDGLTFSPPFVLCIAISSNGMLAAGTADGRLLIGRGGMKRPTKKKSRKWKGLDREHISSPTVSSGPVVALAFSEPDILVYSTLLGNLTQVRIMDGGQDEPEILWQEHAQSLAKVNALTVSGHKMIAGGISHDGKGVTFVKEL